MQQQISVITLGIADLARSRRFYADGFGWKPVFENGDIIFYQMNGLMLGTWPTKNLEGDMQRKGLATPGAFALAHNVPTQDDVQPLIERLAKFGGRICATPTPRPTAAFAATSPIPTITPGRSPGTRCGRSVPKAT